MRQIVIDMNLQAEKIKLIEWLVSIKDMSILEKVANVRDTSLGKEEEIRLEPMSVEELERRARASEEAIKNGDVMSFNELKKEMKSW